MIKVICVGGGKTKGVPEVRPPRPERVPVFDDLVRLTRLVEAYQDYAQEIENISSLLPKNWRCIVNDSRVEANRVHLELKRLYVRWRKMG